VNRWGEKRVGVLWIVCDQTKISWQEIHVGYYVIYKCLSHRTLAPTDLFARVNWWRRDGVRFVITWDI
jgi:hypothetical protein